MLPSLCLIYGDANLSGTKRARVYFLFMPLVCLRLVGALLLSPSFRDAGWWSFYHWGHHQIPCQGGRAPWN